jgi:hypothetical protein
MKRGPVSGSVVYVVKAEGARVTYFWEYSADEASWIQLADTRQATTTLAGLVPGQTYYFRYRTLKGRVKSDFSAVLRFMVT